LCCLLSSTCVRFGFSSSTSRDWLRRTSPKWPVMRRLRRRTLTQSVPRWCWAVKDSLNWALLNCHCTGDVYTTGVSEMLQTINVAVARQWTTSSFVNKFPTTRFPGILQDFQGWIGCNRPASEDKDQHITKKSIPLEFQQGIWWQKTRLVPQHRPHLSWQSAVKTDSFISIPVFFNWSGTVNWNWNLQSKHGRKPRDRGTSPPQNLQWERKGRVFI